jgi:2-polyprenyl-3-methyl-5-hydroxy-6-metoxy-1,4-benzoquinol methylase
MLQQRSNRRAFAKIYENNLWGEAESRSGAGSSLEFSVALRKSLPLLLTELNAASLLDLGCGDFNWMRTVDLGAARYTGVDVVESLIRCNTEVYASRDRSFLVADITKDRLPAADVALCRHCLIHLPNSQVLRVLANLKISGTRYLLATTNPGVLVNVDTWPGSFRSINMQITPFNLPPPLRSLQDSTSDDQVSVLGLWRIADVEAD